MRTLFKPLDFLDKENAVSRHTVQLLNMAQSMIDFDGLPETIPKRLFINMLQTSGYAAILDPQKTKGEFHIFTGGFGGEPDIDYEPTILNISNPRLTSGSISAKIGTDVIVIRHDPYVQGLLPIIIPYATLLAENEISIRMAIINSRDQSHISANDDSTYQSAMDYLRDLERGKLGAIHDTQLFDSLHYAQNPTGSDGVLSALIETEQFLSAKVCNAIGLNANYNMKRESINSNEAQMSDDGLLPTPDTIMRSIREGCEEANKRFSKYGLNIVPKFNSAWEERREEGEEDAEESARPEPV